VSVSAAAEIDASAEGVAEAVPVEEQEDFAGTGGPILPWWSFIALCLAMAFLGFAGAWFLKSTQDPSCEGGCPNATDIGFFRDMYDHHDQAVQMAESYRGNPNPGGYAKVLAGEIVLAQRREQGIMYGWLQSWGLALGDVDRTDAMAWMGEPTTVQAMPGMQTPDDISALGELPSGEATEMFYLMMRDHHVGGVEMAAVAVRQANNEYVQRYAIDWANAQAFEIAEIDIELEKIGVDTSQLPSVDVPDEGDITHGHGGK